MNDIEALLIEARHEIALAQDYAYQSDLEALRIMYLSVSDLLRRLTDALEDVYRESHPIR